MGTSEITDLNSVVISATGHNYKWVIDKAATATEDGSKHEECVNCQHKKASVEIPAVGSYHVHSYSAVVVAPTCTKRGYTEHMCSCGEAYRDTYVKPVGHADADSDGFCDVCFEKLHTGGGGGVSKYTVKFETNGGTTVANKSVTRNAKLDEPILLDR